MRQHRRSTATLAAALATMLAAALTSSAGADGIALGHTEVVSKDTAGGRPDEDVTIDDITPDGRFVTFSTFATDIVASDSNSRSDVFVVDRLLGTTQRASISNTEVQGNESAYGSSISDDGRYVAFVSYSNNLVTGDSNTEYDVFVRDRVAGTTVRASTKTGGTQIAGITERGRISGDGRFVVFETNAAAVVAGETGTEYDVFVKTLASGVTELVSESGGGTDGNGDSRRATISADGRYVAFDSAATNLGASDTNGALDVYLRDRTGDTTSRISVSSTEVQGNGISASADISGNGRFVAFSSQADNLASGETGDPDADVFRRDLNTGTTARVSVTSSETKGNGVSGTPSISGDGDRVAFLTYAANLGATPPDPAVAVRDLSAGTTTQIPANPTGTDGGVHPVISPDGRYVGWDDTFISNDDGRAYLRVLAGQSFSDVPGSHLFFEEISWLVDNGVADGYPDGTYRPTNDVTRQAMAAFVEGYMGSQFSPPATPTFSDVPTSHPFFHDIEWAVSEGYVNGYPDGTYRPTNDVTRQAMAAILYRMAGSPAFSPPGSPTFPDVGTSHPFRTEIEWLASTGITSGFPDGGFHPDDPVTRQSTAAFLMRLHLVVPPAG